MDGLGGPSLGAPAVRPRVPGAGLALLPARGAPIPESSFDTHRITIRRKRSRALRTDAQPVPVMQETQPPSSVATESPSDPARSPSGARQAIAAGPAVTWRSTLISLVLIPVNAYWLVQMERIRYSAHPTTVSLFFIAVFIVLVVMLGSALVGHYRPTWALRRGGRGV